MVYVIMFRVVTYGRPFLGTSFWEHPGVWVEPFDASALDEDPAPNAGAETLV